ncbi:MarR family transcriptional regulator [Bifidobacterium pseudolongum subsp. globosum]|uniref:MarR family transcriptional regulator n=2 Tax=Bifidobacterium pseudolongum TaxID=1694 RepID=A0A4Q5ARL1_9BIFI|nr:MarR family transcriptional regulator [Bifidobacterium pseudolongum subsp. globosum]
MPAAGPVMPMTHSDPNEFEPPRADAIEYAQAAHSDLDTRLTAFFEKFRRIDLIYGAYGRRCGLSFSAYLIFDYICQNDGTSQREICAYTLLPR